MKHEDKKKVIGVIPARYFSSRFPGKPLAKICGKPMILWVIFQAKKARFIDKVIVATDDNRIRHVVESVGSEAVMTSKKCRSGTDRIAEAIEHYPDYDIIVNIQGDEPLISPYLIDETIKPLLMDKNIVVSTACKLCKQEEINSPDVVKVVRDKNGNALYFSRATIPYNRTNLNSAVYKHIGLYVYQKSFLNIFKTLPPSFLEKTESLEQLRILEHGYKIYVIETKYESYGVDRPEHIKEIEKILGKKHVQ